jgi:hypothetical protein
MVRIAKTTKRYTFDLMDEEWERMAPHFSANKTGYREVEFRGLSYLTE